MVFNKSAFYLNSLYNIRLTDSFLERLEDAVRKKDNVLVTIDASHYGFLNKNGVIYRHDTVRDCIPSFVYPDTKPIIENHRPQDSERFGRVVAADYKETKYYNELINKGIKLEDLSTQQYMQLCKSTIVPMQGDNSRYNGLAYVQVVGKIDHAAGVQKILDSEFLHVSIGADPKKMICSECGQDQVVKMCDHYYHKGKNGIFMLAEELEYEELSFVQKPADKFGKVVFIHDGVEEEIESVEIDAEMDVILAKDFFKIADGKKIVCMDNICKVINEPEDTMKRTKEGQKTINVSYVDEFTADQLKDIKLTDSEEEVNLEEVLKLSDEVMGELTNRDFAVVQKTQDGVKRRFPIHNSDNIKAAVQLINKAEDLTEPEKDKAVTSISRAAKKAGIEFKIEDAEPVAEETVPAVTDEVEEPTNTDTEVKTIASITDELVEMLKEVTIEDGAENPLVEVLGKLALVNSVVITDFITAQIETEGKEVVEKGIVQGLKDEISERDEEIAILEDQLMDVNYTLRSGLVDEILSAREALEIADSDKEAEKAEFMKLPYDQLLKQRNDFNLLKSKLTDKDVSNSVDKEINVIPDPLNDAEGTEETPEVPELIDAEPEKSLSEKEIIQIFTNLFRNR